LIHLEFPKQNNGLLVVQGENIMVNSDKEVVDALTFLYPLSDPNNLLYLKAVLLPNGSGISLMEPTVTEYFWKWVVMIHNQETTEACEKMVTEHRNNAAALKKAETHRTKKILLEFPGGMRCKADHFSSKILKLKVPYRELEIPIRNSISNKRFVQYAWWKVAINGRECVLESAGSWNDEDPFAEANDRINQALNGMNI
jgi:hypothetical protein